MFTTTKQQSVFFILSLTLLGACGGGPNVGGIDNTPPVQTPDDTGDHTVQDCSKIVFDIAELESKGIKLPSIQSGFIVEPNSWLTTCKSTQTINGVSSSISRRGYTQLKIFKKMSGAQIINNDDRSDAELTVQLKDEDINESNLQDILSNMDIQTSQSTEDIFETASLTQRHMMFWMLADGLELKTIRLDQNSEDNQPTFRAWGQDAHDFRTLLKLGKRIDVVAIDSSIARTDLDSPVTFRLKLGSENMKLKSVSFQNVISRMWQNHATKQSTKVNVMFRANRTLMDGNMLPEDFKSNYPGLKSMRREAKSRWGAPTEIDDLDVQSLDLIAYLGELTPRLEFYLQWQGKFVDALRLNEKTALIKAMNWFQNSKDLTVGEREYVLELAIYLKSTQINNPWKLAVKYAPKLNYSLEKMTFFNKTLMWMGSSAGPNFSGTKNVEESLELISRENFNEQALDLVKVTFTWLYKNSGVSMSTKQAAYVETKILTNRDNWSRETLELSKATFTWLYTNSGVSMSTKRVAYAETKNLMNRENWNNDSLDLFKQTFTWLYTNSGASMSTKMAAYNEGTNLMNREKWDSNSLALFKKTFEWLYRNSGASMSTKQAALKKTKKFTSKKLWTEKKLTLMKDTFSWLYSNSGPSLSTKAATLRKSEAYIFDEKMDRLKLNWLKKSFNKFAKDHTKATALRKAEIKVFGKEI